MPVTKEQIDLQQECITYADTYLVSKNFIRYGSNNGYEGGSQNTLCFERPNKDNSLTRVEINLGFQMNIPHEKMCFVIRVKKGNPRDMYEVLHDSDYTLSSLEFKRRIEHIWYFNLS